MTVESDGDRSAMLADFGETVTVGDSSVTAIWLDPHLEILEVEADEPALLVKTSDVTSAEHGTAVTRAGSSYTVVGLEHDGTGFTLIRLHDGA